MSRLGLKKYFIFELKKCYILVFKIYQEGFMENIFCLSMNSEKNYQQFNEIPKENYLIKKVYTVAKKTLDFLCKHQTLLAIAGFSYLLIEVGTAASELDSGEKYVSEESTEIKSNFTLELWNKFCPKKKFRQKDKLKELAYLNKCIKKICKHSAIYKVDLNKTIMNWCNTANVNKLYKLLKRITKIIDESQKKNPDEWTQANIIGTLVTAVSAIVVGVTSIIGTIITCKAAKAASSMARTIPSLTSGLQTIVSGTAETTRAILEATGTGAAEVIPMETLNILSQVSETISHSLSYHSIEDIPLESGVVDSEISNVGAESIDTNLQSLGENIAPEGEVVGEAVVNSLGSIVGSAGSGIAGSLGSVVGGSITHVGSIASFILESIGISVLSKPGEVDFSNKIEENNAVTNIDYKMKQKYLDDFVSNTTEKSNITNMEVLHLKHSLLNWNNSFCFFDSPNLACRLRSPRHSMEKMILIPLENLRKMFSENLPGLCYSFWQELWCNWSKFFDILSIERNMTQYNDSCPWDQFFLSVEESSNNLYQIASSLRENGCYNETVMIRV